MFEKRRQTDSGTSGGDYDPRGCECTRTRLGCQPIHDLKFFSEEAEGRRLREGVARYRNRVR